MPRHKDFQKIHSRFVKQYGEQKGSSLYLSWLNSKGYNDSKPFPNRSEKKEKICLVKGCEIKETDFEYHVTGLIATDHIDDLDSAPGIEIPDIIPIETLHSFAKQMNQDHSARVMGVHHSEGRPINPEYFGEADITNNLVSVISLEDGKNGLYVDTKLLKNDPETPNIIERFESGDLNSFSITYDTDGFMSTDFGWVDDKLVRIIGPETKLYGYTAASDPVNPNAIATGYGYKEFKELVKITEVSKMSNEEKEKLALEAKEKADLEAKEKVKKDAEAKVLEDKENKIVELEGKLKDNSLSDAEKKEFEELKLEKKELEKKEVLDRAAEQIALGVLKKLEIKEKVIRDNSTPEGGKDLSFELKEFREILVSPDKLEIKEQFRRAAAVCEYKEIDWRNSITTSVEQREYKHFGVNGNKLEFKGLGLTTNQNADTDYLQSAAELQDIYDPVIYNALNQAVVTWNVLLKDDFSGKGNNQIQFTLKTAANTSAAFYNGNSVSTGNVTRLKFQTKFKKVQVGVSVDGDMIAAARGGPVQDVFAQEVLDSADDMMAVVNAALYAEVGLESAAAPIGFEYITDSAGNTNLYNLTRSAANKLAPASAADTYINQASTIVSMGNLRAAIRQAKKEGANKSNLVFFCDPIQADLLRGKFDAAKRHLTDRDTRFGFSTDLWVDGVPVFEDKDCNDDDWFCVDLETHRIGIWIPPTLERLGKSADSEDAFLKSYLGTYNRAPRRMVQIYGCATS